MLPTEAVEPRREAQNAGSRRHGAPDERNQLAEAGGLHSIGFKLSCWPCVGPRPSAARLPAKRST